MGKKKEFTGVWIPRNVWEDDRLSVYDKLVMAVVSGLARGENGCFATNKHLAEFCRFSERQVSKSVGVLVKFGYLRAENSKSPVRRLHVSASGEARTTCEITAHDMRGNCAPCARYDSTTCEVTAHDMRGSNDSLPFNYNYNNIYNNIYNNARAENKPELREIEEYCREVGNSVDPVRFWRYYDAARWVDKDGRPVNWRQKMVFWEAREAERTSGASGGAEASADSGSFDTEEFFEAALARAGYDDSADGECPWME